MCDQFIMSDDEPFRRAHAHRACIVPALHSMTTAVAAAVALGADGLVDVLLREKHALASASMAWMEAR